MTVGEAKQFLYELVLLYHPKDTIVWTKTGGVKPKSPFITLAVRNVERSSLPIANDVGENYYNYSMIFEINLYTIGKPITGTSAYENTAMEDLEEFVRFLESGSGSGSSSDSKKSHSILYGAVKSMGFL